MINEIYKKNTFEFITEDGVKMEEGKAMWRISNSHLLVFSEPSRVKFSHGTGYNDGDVSRNPFHKNHIHYYDYNKAMDAIKKRIEEER